MIEIDNLIKWDEFSKKISFVPRQYTDLLYLTCFQVKANAQNMDPNAIEKDTLKSKGSIFTKAEITEAIRLLSLYLLKHLNIIPERN